MLKAPFVLLYLGGGGIFNKKASSFLLTAWGFSVLNEIMFDFYRKKVGFDWCLLIITSGRILNCSLQKSP